MDGTLSEMLLPRRKSATKAARAFAGQLDSTDDDSQGSGSDGEPKKNASKKGSRRGGGAGKTYGRRTKAKAAAVFNSMSGPGQLVQQFASTRPKSRPIANRKGGSSPLPMSSPLKMACKSTPVGVEESTTCARLNSNQPSLAIARNAQSTLKLDDDGCSDLSSLPGDSRPASPDSEVEIVEIPAPVLGPSRPACDSSTQSTYKKIQWSTQNLGPYVWVLVEPKNVRVFDPNLDKNDHQDRLWWPGKIISARSTDIPLQVKLFKLKGVTITAPCEGNVVSKLDLLGRWRFKNPTFVSSLLLQQQQQPISASPRKKSKYEREDINVKRREATERKWKDAVEEMRQEEEEEEGSDYLPGIGEMFTRPLPFMSPTSESSSPHENLNGHKKKGKRKRGDLSDDNDWEPPGPDETLQIPGECILGRVAGNGPSAIQQFDHWPAKILAYVPPSNPKQQPKYRVRWLDGSDGLVNRSWFYTLADEGFATCKMGAFESSVTEVANDDENEDFEAVKARWDFSRRSLSPEATVPQSMAEFREFSIRLQFAYTKPVLRAILNKEYGPVMALHNLFMAGGLKRVRLNHHSSRKGNMDVYEVEELTNYLKEWCLRSRPPPRDTRDKDTNEEDDQVEILNGRDVTEMNVEKKIHPECSEQYAPNNSDIEAGIVVELDGSECRSPSPQATEVMPSSPPEVPPSSSFPSSRAELEHSLVSENAFTGAEHQSQMPPRQKGCDEYESLTGIEKLHYCTAILLPECIRQILLWKVGARNSMELLDAAEEQELFDKGEQLLNETDWVFDIKRARQRAEMLLKLKSNGTGRRRAQPINYRELDD